MADVYSTLTLAGLSGTTTLTDLLGTVTSAGLSCTVLAGPSRTVTLADIFGTVTFLVLSTDIVICVTTSWQHEYVTLPSFIQTTYMTAAALNRVPRPIIGPALPYYDRIGPSSQNTMGV